MSRLENPFKLTPAPATQFVGRHDILKRWQDRLTPESDAWINAQSWLIIGSGGMGKTSLLNKMAKVAQDDFNAYVVYLDLGHYRQLDREEDFFHYLDTHLPPAKKWSSRLRRWFGLPVDASTGQLTAKFLSLLSHFAVAFSHVDWGGLGFEFSPPGNKSKQSAGFGLRLIQAFNSLAILSEEQDRPVVILIDQVGKIHDAYRWLLVGYQFLQFAERIHLHKVSNIICGFSLRPERKGLLEYELEYYLRTPLFKKDVYQVEHVHPFQEQEAKIAVIERTKGKIGWGYSIAGKIAKVLNTSVGIDPYHAILGASAIWEYLYSGNDQKYPSELDDATVYEIVRQGHGYLLDNVRRSSATQWAVLSLLSFYPVGLTVDAITEQLNHRKKNLSIQEVEQAVAALSDQAGHRLLDNTPNALPPKYSVSHDILRKYLQEMLPVEEKIRQQVQRLLDDGVWRHENDLSAAPFSQWDLTKLWQHNTQLSFGIGSWKAIVNSELNVEETKLPQWVDHYPAAIELTLSKLDRTNIKSLVDFRFYLITAYIHPTRERLAEILKYALNAHHPEYAVRAAEILYELGEQSISLSALKHFAFRNFGISNEGCTLAVVALGRLLEGQEDVLSAFSEITQRKRVPKSVMMQSVVSLQQIGEPALTLLKEIAQNSQDKEVCLRSAKALEQLGERDIALSLLSSLLKETAEKVTELKLHMQAAIFLGELGERDIALPILYSVLNELPLAKHPWDFWLILQAAKGLAHLGEQKLSLPVLNELAQKSGDEHLRLEAAKALEKLGERDLALSTLHNLAQNSLMMRMDAIATLELIGEPALPVLSEIVQNSNYATVIARAGLALGQLGQRDLALSTLNWLVQNANSERGRAQAAIALAECGERDIALSVLGEMARNVKSKSLDPDVIEALGKFGEVALPLLIPISWHGNGERNAESATLNSVNILKTQINDWQKPT